MTFPKPLNTCEDGARLWRIRLSTDGFNEVYVFVYAHNSIGAFLAAETAVPGSVALSWEFA